MSLNGYSIYTQTVNALLAKVYNEIGLQIAQIGENLPVIPTGKKQVKTL